MKKVFMISGVSLLLASVVIGQTRETSLKKDIAKLAKKEEIIKKEKKSDKKELRKLEGNEVSYRSKQAFYTDFGNLPVDKWVRSANFDEAIFTKKGKVMTAYYDADSKLVGTVSNESFSDLPATAQKLINDKYPAYSKKAVILFDDNELNKTDMTLYGNQFDDADNYFAELKKDGREIVLKINMAGNVSFFKQIR